MQQKFYFFTEPSAIITNDKEKVDIIYCMTLEELNYYHFFRLENDTIKSIIERNDCSVGIILRNINSLEKKAILFKDQKKYNNDTKIEITNYLNKNNIFNIEIIENINELLIPMKNKTKYLKK